MLRPYNGEYLLQPFGLHLGMNWCSHNCYYCFANLDQPERRGDWTQVARMMRRAADGDIGKSLTAKWLSEKRPILASNVSDPFAKSNDKAFQEIFTLAHNLGHTFAFQTRGGALAKDTLSQSRKTSVYISVTSDDEDYIKQREPGAPSFRSRLELIQHAKACGHSVIVGINPYVPDWWGDIEGFVAWLKAHGVDKVWWGTIHISNLQVRQMPSSKQAVFAQEIGYMRKKVLPDQDKIDDMVDMLAESGINSFSGPLSERGGFWKEAHAKIPGCFKTVEDLSDELRAFSQENGGKPVAFSEAWFTKFTGVTDDFESSEWGDFVSKSQKTMLEEAGASRKNVRRASSYHKMLFALASQSGLFHSKRFTRAVDGNSANARDVTDKNGFSILIWMPDLSESETSDINNSLLIG